MRFRSHAFILLLTSASIIAACQKEDSIIPSGNTPEKEEGEYKGLIPQSLDQLPKLFINTPGAKGVSSNKTVWTELCTIQIKAKSGGKETVVFDEDSLKIRGRGNTTWKNYPKKPYRFTLEHKANLIGSGQTKKWVLLANWMDRTLLRNVVAFEAARRSSIEWTPSGTFVEFYLDGAHQGNYWLGEKINVEQGNFLADYLFEFDTSDNLTGDFQSSRGVWKKSKDGGIPVNIKYPDMDDEKDPSATKKAAKAALDAIEAKIFDSGKWEEAIDKDSFIDWLLVHELCMNREPNHPKSCFFYIRDGKLHAGPVWDFDWGTFPPPGNRMGTFLNTGALYFPQLLTYPAFRQSVKLRWKALKPQFQSLESFIDRQAAWISESEQVNHNMWPCYPNPLSEDGSGMINYDENLSFQEAVDGLKKSLKARIQGLDNLINKL